MNAQFFKPTTRARTKLTPLYIARQTGGHHRFRNQDAAQLFRVDAQIHVLKERYTSQHPMRHALPLVQIELWVNCSGQTRQFTCGKTNVQCALAQKHCADNRWSATLHGNRLQRSTSTHYRLPAVEVTSNIHMSTHKSCLQNWVCFWTTS